MNKYNQIQKKFIELPERAHYQGIRHRGLTGTACEDLLIRALKKEVPALSFNRGVIKLNRKESVGRQINSRQDLSSQIDVIIYKGKPLHKLESSVIVHVDQVLGVIELKKWVYPRTLPSIYDKLQEEGAKINQKAKKKIALFLVVFRLGDKTIAGDKLVYIQKYKNLYCFYGGGAYPWQEKERWAKFYDKNRNPYLGQFQSLLKAIGNLKSATN